MRRFFIRNTSGTELGVMLEPWTDREDVEVGGRVLIEGEFADKVIVEFGEESFLSVLCPPGCTLRKA
jgi:hypothetical protein